MSARFDEVVTILNAFGFHVSRVRRSHHIFVHPEMPELVNLQDVHGEAKSYQVLRFLKIVERHNLTFEVE
jgi:predicted RNA binding protein YcfA (HicA-like mRNA interferase family)